MLLIPLLQARLLTFLPAVALTKVEQLTRSGVSLATERIEIENMISKAVSKRKKTKILSAFGISPRFWREKKTALNRLGRGRKSL